MYSAHLVAFFLERRGIQEGTQQDFSTATITRSKSSTTGVFVSQLRAMESRRYTITTSGSTTMVLETGKFWMLPRRSHGVGG